MTRRIRSIKPEFWDDETNGKLSIEARLFFIGTWNLADDKGRLQWNAQLLRSSIFVYDHDLTEDNVVGMMAELEALGFIRTYTAGRNSGTLASIVNFEKHQKINRPSPPKWPAPPWESDEPSEKLTEGGVVGEVIGKGEVVGRKQGKRKATPPPDSFEITPELRRWAAEKVPRLDLGRETEKFLTHHRARGNSFVRWDQAWRGWMLKALEWGPKQREPGEAVEV